MSHRSHEVHGGAHTIDHGMGKRTAKVVLEVSGLQFASEKAVVERVLTRWPGVVSVEANPVAQTATVTFDPETTSVADLRGSVEECGYHCAGRSVPNHVCDAMAEPSIEHEGHPPAPERHVSTHSDHAEPAVRHAEAPSVSPHDAMGHGGHAQMSMDEMVRDMRRRFLVAAVLSAPILLWSPIGRDVLGFAAPAPFGLRDDVFMLLLSLPVVFWAAWIFFDGAVRAPRARTLDMMVLVSVAVGAEWLYSVVVTFTGGGEVFYEAVTVLAAFVLLPLKKAAVAGVRDRGRMAVLPASIGPIGGHLNAQGRHRTMPMTPLLKRWSGSRLCGYGRSRTQTPRARRESPGEMCVEVSGSAHCIP